MIEIKDLEKNYGRTRAVKKISFRVETGEILGFLGPNGAGKTTTMNMITGYISMSGGSVCVDGKDILENPIEARRSIGYLPEQPPLYLDMTVEEYLDFVYDLKGVKMNVLKGDHLSDVMDATGITEVKKRRIKNLSKGYRQRVGLAQALVGKPDVLILDEPTVGLDPNQIIEIRSLIKNLKKEHTVILSTHILSEVSAICDRVVIINNGEIIAVDTPENLGRILEGKYILDLKTEGGESSVAEKLREIEGVTSVTETGKGSYRVEAQRDAAKDVSALCNAEGMLITELKRETASLEEVFAELTKEGRDEDESDL